MNAGVIVEVSEPTFRSFAILALFHAQIRVLRLLLAPGPAPSRTAGKARERAQDAPDAGGTRPYIHIYNIWVHTGSTLHSKTRKRGCLGSVDPARSARSAGPRPRGRLVGAPAPRVSEACALHHRKLQHHAARAVQCRGPLPAIAAMVTGRAIGEGGFR